MKAICIIPARYGSTRFPGKPLMKIGDKPMIQWVYERSSRAKTIEQVIVATDDERIEQAVLGFGGQVVMTPGDLPSGSDRVAFAARQFAADVIVNVQGDEPLIQAGLLDKIVSVFRDKRIRIATPIKKIKNQAQLTDANLVRVVRDNQHFALYFSRSVIPYLRDVPNKDIWLEKHCFFKHIGVYAYRSAVLQEITKLPLSELEAAERLEQLRFLENGYRIYTVETDYESWSVDTQEDLNKINQLISEHALNVK